MLNIGKLKHSYDFVVVGSGFGGSITSMGLKQLGYNVCLIEKGSHPRFAIGESSTPIADMILRDLADGYDLPFLKQISRYGEWQTHYPDVGCGLKRGFSYYHHQKGRKFESDDNHKHELLVAASVDDHNSDTNWLRSDIDQFLVKKANGLGIDLYENSEILKLNRSNEFKEWSIIASSGSQTLRLKAKWVIDATGSSHFSKKFFNTSNEISEFKTNSEAVYTHLRDVQAWAEYLNENSFTLSDYPYNPDDSALHHIIEEGWIWMLRFNDGLLSCGLVLDKANLMNPGCIAETQVDLADVIKQYPSIKQILKRGVLAELPGKFIHSGRLQRKLNRMYGEGWIALNHTAGFVDPMHSTGIAHTLSGIERLLQLFPDNSSVRVDENTLRLFQEKTFKELEFIDILVSSTYRSRWNTELFNAAVMLYFVASVHYEQSRLRGKIPEMYLGAHNPDLTQMASQLHDKITALEVSKNEWKARDLVNEIAKLIEPFNDVGLMNDSNKNMYRHTAVMF